MVATETAKPSAITTIATAQEYRDRYRATQPDMVIGSVTDAMSTSLGVADGGGGTSINVANGSACVQGPLYTLSGGPLNILVGANGGGSNRFDIVVLTYDSTHNPIVYCRVITGTPGAGLPAMTNSATGVWDVPIAHFEKTPGGAIVNMRNRRAFADNNGSVLSVDDANGTLGAGWFPAADRVGRTVTFWPSMNTYVWDGVAWAILEGTFHKSGDQSVNNSSTLVNDTALFAPLAANTLYAFDGYIRYFSPTATPDLKAAFTVPAGAFLNWTSYALTNTATTRVDNPIFVEINTSGGFVSPGTVGGSSIASFPVRGMVSTAGTSGLLQFQFAQNTPTVENTTVGVFSYLHVKKIG